MKAVWNGQLLAESDDTVVMEKSHYFPPDAIKKKFFRKSKTHTTFPWKGEANYYTLVVGGRQNRDAAWSYPHPNGAAAAIKDRIAFWKDVEVID